MTDQESDQTAALLNRALETLDEWRHLPAYQLERRVDVFFGLLLPRIVEAVFGGNSELEPMTVIPEFPLRKGLIDPDGNSENDNQSVKVDFAVFCRGEKKKRLVLVELKTDNKSIDCDQLKRMRQAQSVGVKELLRGVVTCGSNSAELRKYAQLIWKLDEIGCICVPKSFRQMDMKEYKPGLTDNFRNLRKNFDSIFCSNWDSAEIKLALIFPGSKMNTRSSKVEKFLADPPSGVRLVDFLEAARSIGESPLSRLLEEWANCEAGRVTPWAD